MITLTELTNLARITDQAEIARTAMRYPAELQQLFPETLVKEAYAEISQWPGYEPTILRDLNKLAEACRVGAVHYKDESNRFGLGSFKALGGAYAVIRHLSELLSRQSGEAVSMQSIRSGAQADQAAATTVTSATDGNHGRSVAWGAKQAGCGCTIYIHRDVSEGREKAMADLGAQVIRIDGDYDESVRRCAADAKANGWQVISDTSYEGYLDTPRQVMAGYTVMVREILDQLAGEIPTHVFVQAGVGGLAAAICAAFWMATGESLPRFVIVESEKAACILESVRQGMPSHVDIAEETVMAGLSCGEISLIAWEILRRGAADFVTLPDDAVGPTMRLMADGALSEEKIEAGECATPGVIALMAAANDAGLRNQMRIGESSRVLVFGCEGATDPEIYQQLLAG